MEILLEEMSSKSDLVLVGHATMNAKIDGYHRQSNERHDMTEFLLKVLARDMAYTRANLTAHSADTEAHSRYRGRK